MFKVGDIVTGRGFDGYNWSTSDAILKVTKIGDRTGYMHVKLLKHKTMPEYIGGVSAVSCKDFKHVRIRNTKTARIMNPEMVEKEGWLYYD